MKTRRIALFFFCLVLLFVGTEVVRAQDEVLNFGQTTIYLESLGNYSRHAITCDQFFAENVSARFGIGTGGVDRVTGPAASFMVNYMFGNLHKLEVSFGYAAPLKSSGYGTAMFIGYRFQPKENGFSLRFAVNPSLTGRPLTAFGSDSNYNGMQIAFGYAF
ncbi:MAG: hypothetical protein HY562_01930 [Ignavibacteriales bacterium]|nr:hypothetical protein [Ignavibacteriales bacterium]